MSEDYNSRNFFSFKIRWATLLIVAFCFTSWGQSVTRFAGGGATVTGVGTINWNNPGNIVANDAANASLTLNAGVTSRYLVASNFGFTIPTSAIITGVQVDIDKVATGGTLSLADVRDNIVRLAVGGAPVGSNLAVNAKWPTSFTIVGYGGATNLWGTTLTPAQVNATNFGVYLAITNQGLVSSTAQVDFIRVTIYYTNPIPTITNLTATSTCLPATPFIVEGTNLATATSVTIGGVPVASFSVLNATQISVTPATTPVSGTVQVTTPSGTATSSQTYTVYSSPLVNPIDGISMICAPDSTLFTNTTPGGVWTSSDGSVATVDSSGNVTGVSGGTATISYTVTDGVTGCSTTVSAPITVYNQPTVIQNQPVAKQTVCSGTTAIISINATGSALTYQWYRGSNPLSDGGNISGATTSTLTINNVTIADAGNDYYCVVTGACGDATSDTSGIIVIEAVEITAQPVSITRCVGTNAMFSVSATGTGLSYQWYKGGIPLSDGGNISGATTPTLTISNVGMTDAASDYHCVVSGTAPCNSVSSDDVELAVNETPQIVSQPPTVQTVCVGDPVGIAIFATGGSLTYQWYKGGTALTDTPNIFGTNTDTLYFMAATLADAGDDYYVVVKNACTGEVTSTTSEIIVNEKPVAPNQNVSTCSGTAFFGNPIDGAPGTVIPAGTTYSWDAPVVTGGMTGGSAASGQALLGQTLINPTNVPQTATYIVTPQSGTSGNCIGDDFTVTVTVNPTPSINNISISVCSGDMFDISPSNGSGNIVPAGTTYSWSAPSVTGGLTGGTAGNNQASISQTLINPTNLPQTATYNVTATSGACTGSTFTVMITVDPQPTVAASPTSQQVCSGDAITAITMSNPNSVPGTTSYTWTRDNTANVTGMPAAGTGTISGVLNNTTSSSQVVTFTINAVSDDGCISNSTTVSVTVSPIPLPVATPASQTVCAGQPITTVNFSTSNSVAGTTFTWVRDNTTNLTGIPASGSGPISGTFVNNTTSSQTTTFTVTASADGCSSTTTFTIAVNPQPTVAAAPSTQTICSGNPITGIILSNPNSIPGATYSWTRDNTTNVTGIAASGNGSLISGTLNNVTGADQTVTFTVYATAWGCTSVAGTAEVIVRATPIVTATPATQNICNGSAITTVNIGNSNNVPGTTYSWVRSNTANITGIAASGTGNTISGVLSNVTTSNQTTVFTITATSPDGCSRTTTASVTIFPDLIAPVIGTSHTVCAGSTPTPLSIVTAPSGGTAAYTYQWQSSLTSGGPWTNISGATGTSYQPPVTNGSTPTTYYRLVTTGCGTEYSNVVSVAVANNLNFTFSTSGGSTTLCSGAAFTPTITSGEILPDSAIRYTWSGDVNYITPVTGGPIGTTTIWPFPWLPIFAISSATLPLTVVNNTNANVTTTVYITPVIYNASTNAIICTLSPQPVTVTIRPRPQATVTAPPAGTTICSGTSAGITMTGNVTNAQMSYSITRAANPNVTSSASFPVNSGNLGVGASYTLNDVLTNTTGSNQTVTYTITPSSAVGCTGTPITYSVTVAPMLTPGTIGPNQTVCNGGDPATINQLTAAIGGGTLTYQWYSGSSASGPWNPIGGATGITYDPPAGMTTDTWFVRQVTSTVSGVTCSVQNSVPVRISVNTPTAGSISGNQTICSGSAPTTITSTALGTGPAGSTITYRWESSITGCGGPWTNIAGATGSSYTLGALTQTTYFRRITVSTLNAVQCTAESNCVVVNVNTVTGGSVGSDQVICGNNPAAFTEIVPATGSGTLSYRWQSNTTGCGGTWTDIPGATAAGATYDPPAGLTVTTYYRRVTTSTLNGVSCTAVSNCITVTANSVTGGTIDGNRTVCIGGDPAAFMQTTPSTGTNISYQWQMSSTGGVGTWVDILGANGVNYDHPGPINATTYFRRVTISDIGGTTCTANSNSVTVFINDVTPSTIAGDQTVCGFESATAFTVTSPASGLGVLSYQWQSSTTGCGGSWTNIVGATSPTYNPGSIVQTTYYRVMVTSTINGAVCSAYSNCVTVINNTKTWNGSANSDWNNAANWTPSGVPTSANCVVIPNVTTDPLIIGSDYVGYAHNLTVLPGGRLDVNPTNTLWVTNTINVNPGGNLFVTNNASLLQTDDVANTGTFVVTRITQPMYKFDFTYWGSPLVMGSFTLGNLSPNTLADKYFSWNPTNSGGGGSWIQESAATVMDPTKGYIVRAPQNFSSNPAITQTYTATFIGNVNNGDISIPISIGSLGPGTSDDKMNLIGNPYPSAVDADLFLNDPVNSSLIDGTIYFWTHHAPPSASFPSPFYGTFVYNYSPNGYASYNSLGGTNTVPLGYGGPTPDGKIATGQGFFVKGLASGTARFRNDMRIVGNNSTFFRMGHQKHRIWLNLANTQGAFSQALVGYADGATDGLDRSFDGVAMASNTVSLYSLADDVKLGIQGFALPFEIEDLIPMGYSSTTAGSYTIGIDHVDGVFTNQKVYLEDKLLNTIHDLTVEPYEFATEAGTFDTRFVLRFTDGMLSTPDVDSVKIIAFVNESMFYLQSDNHVKDIKIYDMTGKLITEYRPETVGLFTSEFNFAEGIYIAKIEFHDRQRSSVKLKN